MSITLNYQNIKERIEKACNSVGRDPAEITLIAVSKTLTVDKISQAYDLGIKDFGENRLQEALYKINFLPNDINWHFIGKLQLNKVRKVSNLFECIHSIESLQQIRKIEQVNEFVKVFVQLNLSNESQKSGIRPDKLDELVNAIAKCSYIKLLGLMTMGPICEKAEDMRPYYRQLKELLKRIPQHKCLSIGMSNDFEIAIQEGATHIRLGKLLFGLNS